MHTPTSVDSVTEDGFHCEMAMSAQIAVIPVIHHNQASSNTSA
ncbi:MAG: hypothetical protein ABIQ64_00645 [Candidatus Saccharimonadales bacterium]